MDDKQYYTVQEIAQIVGISKQAIYKRMSTSLSPYSTVIDGKKHLHKDVLRVLIVNESTDDLNKTDNVDKNFTEIISSMNRMIDVLKVQLAAKDKQLEEVNAMLSQALKNQGMVHYTEAVKQIEAPKKPWYKKFKKST
jgi:predicted DNA-binding protein YlxM (UPF0122 family)